MPGRPAAIEYANPYSAAPVVTPTGSWAAPANGQRPSTMTVSANALDLLDLRKDWATRNATPEGGRRNGAKSGDLRPGGRAAGFRVVAAPAEPTQGRSHQKSP